YARSDTDRRLASEYCIFIFQRKYVLDLLKETGKLGCKTLGVPIEKNHRIWSEESPIIEKSQYQRFVGKLIYLSHIRLDIIYVVSVVSQFMHDPRERHLQVVERQVQEKDCCSKKKEHCPWKYVQMIDCGLKIYLRILYVFGRKSSNLEEQEAKCGTYMFCDNNSAISIVHNPVQHDRTKHFEIDRHFIKEKIDNGLIVTAHVPTGLQVTDVFTKWLHTTRFQELNGKLGIIDIHLPT
ncbi:Copia protein, partial [Mucuna pruriens]